MHQDTSKANQDIIFLSSSLVVKRPFILGLDAKFPGLKANTKILVLSHQDININLKKTLKFNYIQIINIQCIKRIIKFSLMHDKEI